KALAGLGSKWVMASVGTDGVDYFSKAAGAIIDQDTSARAESAGLNVSKYLDDYDSYNLFNKLDSSLIKTGSTNTNVGDVVVYLRE
ncbi:glycerate kinase, partial [Candidatus Parcubacteria bacterium]|nr:glycerate kinase [Candidatus Parcubacteria bacterium]